MEKNWSKQKNLRILYTRIFNPIILTVIINKTKYFCPPFVRDWLAINAALVIMGPKRVGPARETFWRALEYATIIPWIPST